MGQVAFAAAFHEVKPGKVVDKVIDMVLDILIPGKGVGQGNWLSRSLRSIENQAERTTRELDIRRDLRDWDNRFPYMHHELIVRYISGLIAYTAATTGLCLASLASSP